MYRDVAIYRGREVPFLKRAQITASDIGTFDDLDQLTLFADNLIPHVLRVEGVLVLDDALARTVDAGELLEAGGQAETELRAAAVHAVIDIVEEENLVERSRAMGEYFITRLRDLQSTHKFIADIRGRGLMIGMELATGKNDTSKLAFEMAMLCERRGVHLTFSYFEPVIRIIPPLIISQEEIDAAITVMDETLSIIERGSSSLNDLLPKNCKSGPFTRGMIDESHLSLRRMWQTSPQQWLNKLQSLRRNK